MRKPAPLRRRFALLRADATATCLQTFGPPLRIEPLEDRIVSTMRWTGRNVMQSGSYDAHGALDPQSLVQRRYHPRITRTVGVAHDVPPEASESLDAALYGGPLFSGFGHFVTEGLARTWAGDRHPDLPIVFSGGTNPSVRAFKPWQQEILALMDLEQRARLITAPLHVRKLFVPSPGFIVQYQFARRHAADLGRIPWARDKRGPKIWISRRGVDPWATPGRDALEDALAAEGWTIFAPHTTSVRHQLDTYANASRIASEQGSALHALIFLKRARGLRVDVFTRDPTLQVRSMNANQATISRRLGLDMRVHRIREEQVLSRRGPRVEKTYATPETYLGRLRR